MTFEYRDHDGDTFTVRPTIGTPAPAILLHISPSNCAHVPLDRVEEVVAGIRDAARTASGQQPDTKPAYYGVNGCTCRAWTGDGGVPRFLRGDESVELISGWEEQPDCPHHAPAANGQKPETTPCGSRSLPTYSGEVVRCVLHVGHAAQCQSAAEWPYVSWPNPSNGVWNPHPGDEPAPAVGQPAEARTADRAALRERVRLAVAQWHLDDSGSGRTIYDLDDAEFGTLADAVLSVLTVEDER